MASEQHAPGPWEAHNHSDWTVDTDSSNSYVYIGQAGSDPVAIAIVAGLDWDNDDRLAAHARLIAAAPELLEAARAVEAVFEIGIINCDPEQLVEARILLRRALAKARAS